MAPCTVVMAQRNRAPRLGTRPVWNCWFPMPLSGRAIRFTVVPLAIYGGRKIHTAHDCHNPSGSDTDAPNPDLLGNKHTPRGDT